MFSRRKPEGIITLPTSDDAEVLGEFSEKLKVALEEVARRLGIEAVSSCEEEDGPELFPLYYDDFGPRSRRIRTEVVTRDQTPETKQERTLGRFFSLYGPTWDRGSTDTVYILGIDGAEHPNPRFDMISVDPNSIFFGIVIHDFYATDFGFRPCPYGNHVGAFEKPGFGQIAPEAIYSEGKFTGTPDEASFYGAKYLAAAIKRNLERAAETKILA